MPLGRQLDENVFKTGSKRADLRDSNTVLFQLRAKMVEVQMLVNECVNRLAENGCAANSRDRTGVAQRESYLRHCDFYPVGALRLHIGQFAEGVRRAIGNELAEVDVPYVAAAFGFVHVVSGDEKRYALPG